MSQVIIEFGQVALSEGGRDTPASDYQAVTEEITSSGTSQTTTAETDANAQRNIVTVINNGTDAIWVAFDATATAASPSRFVAPNTTRDFAGIKRGVTVSVINDS